MRKSARPLRRTHSPALFRAFRVFRGDFIFFTF